MRATSTAPRGAAHAAVTDDSPVLLKNPPPIRTYMCHLAPHRCGDQVECRVNGLMFVSPALLKKLLLIRTYQCHPAPTPLWGLGGVPGEWADVCGFLKPPESETEWQVRMHGGYTIPYSTLRLRERRTKVAITKFGCISLTSTPGPTNAHRSTINNGDCT